MGSPLSRTGVDNCRSLGTSLTGSKVLSPVGRRALRTDVASLPLLCRPATVAFLLNMDLIPPNAPPPPPVETLEVEPLALTMRGVKSDVPVPVV